MTSAEMHFPVQEGSKLVLRVAGDLYLLGGESSDLVVEGVDARHVHVQQEGNVCTLITDTDCRVTVPWNAGVRVERIGGDGIIAGLAGPAEVSHVGGDLALRQVEKADIAHVGGDLFLAEVGEAVAVRRVGGDLKGEVSGNLSVEMVGGDCVVCVSGGVRLRGGGDIDLGLKGASTEEVVVKSGGDIVLYLPTDFSGRLDLTSGGRDIVVDVQNQHRSMEQENAILTLGKGERLVRLKAGGDIRVVDEPMPSLELDDLLDRMEQEWKTAKPSGGEDGSWEGFAERIQRRAEEAARRAEERVRAAMERMERRGWHREHPAGMWGARVEGWEGEKRPPEPAQPPSPHAPVDASQVAPTTDVRPGQGTSGVSNEERMLVLKMLQEHKITVEEAEELLAALEGQID
ncbi:hypothetical protein ATHL_00651 [Anaerolinea thermolimosa]|uniref:SHOCT-like domain-containing protein n=1 Tax=Anaerolinea thermolimosa TaxID=229919 RepID=UPI000784D715|nr:hypothetical protein [Anaerolinea thermolimosa]GAP05810.1 hypothetical protein ATHL_00651 [Anaerolinea thermolimosa]